MQETQVQSLGWEDPLEKEIATLSSILAWEIWWTEEPGRLQSMGPQRVGHDFRTKQQHASYLKLNSEEVPVMAPVLSECIIMLERQNYVKQRTISCLLWACFIIPKSSKKERLEWLEWPESLSWRNKVEGILKNPLAFG